MNEIKFRAYDRATKEMFFFDLEELQRRAIESGLPDVLVNCDVMRFTGLRDKNGVEIYENDVLQFRNAFDELGVAVGVRWDFDELRRLEQRMLLWRYVDVIGNTVENPDLLPANA